MPNYPGTSGALVSAKSNASPIALAEGESCYLFGVLAASATQLPVNDGNVAGETPAAPQASIAVELTAKDAAGPVMVSVEGYFAAAPGTFSLQIQEADTDADGLYVTPTATVNPNYALYTISAVGSNQQFRADLPSTGGKFLRALLNSRTNAVSLVLKVTRLA